MDEHSMPYYLWVPTSCIDLLQHRNTGRVKDYKAAHLLHILSNHVRVNHETEKSYEFKDLTSDYLKGHYTTDYKNLINKLSDLGIIEVNGGYSTTLHQSMSYRLTKALIAEVLEGNLQKVHFINKPMSKRISKWRRGTLVRHIEQYPFIEREAEMILHLIINTTILESEFEKHLKYIKGKTGLKRPMIAMHNAYRHEHSIKDLSDAKDLLDARVRYISGRVYHPFVNCPKEFRKAVVDEQGKPYVEVDLRSSQAVFLCHVIATAINLDLLNIEFGQPIVFEHDLLAKIEPHILEPSNLLDPERFPGDFTAFVTAVFQDDIYEDASPENLQQNLDIEVTEGVTLKSSTLRIAGAKNLVGEKREKAKRKFFREVFFNHYREENKLEDGRVITKKPYVKDFVLSYPTVIEFCRICAFQSESKKKSRELSLFLQKIESTFFHEIVGTRIAREIDTNFFIVHDAVYCEEQYKNRITQIFKEEAQKLFGYSPLFR